MPRPISVHMFGLRFTTDCQPREKKGQPAHNTMGSEITSSTQLCGLHFRHNGRANTAWYDGHVETITPGNLKSRFAKATSVANAVTFYRQLEWVLPCNN